MYRWANLYPNIEYKMIPFPLFVIRKERRSKCSLTPLEAREDIEFFRAREGWTFDVTGFTILGLDAPQMSEADAGRPLLLLDSTWRLLPQLEACLVGQGCVALCPGADGISAH